MLRRDMHSGLVGAAGWRHAAELQYTCSLVQYGTEELCDLLLSCVIATTFLCFKVSSYSA
jgi:hypothetical protein